LWQKIFQLKHAIRFCTFKQNCVKRKTLTLNAIINLFLIRLRKTLITDCLRECYSQLLTPSARARFERKKKFLCFFSAVAVDFIYFVK
jgi:hypothetical protein